MEALTLGRFHYLYGFLSHTWIILSGIPISLVYRFLTWTKRWFDTGEMQPDRLEWETCIAKEYSIPCLSFEPLQRHTSNHYSWFPTTKAPFTFQGAKNIIRRNYVPFRPLLLNCFLIWRRPTPISFKSVLSSDADIRLSCISTGTLLYIFAKRRGTKCMSLCLKIQFPAKTIG